MNKFPNGKQDLLDPQEQRFFEEFLDYLTLDTNPVVNNTIPQVYQQPPMILNHPPANTPHQPLQTHPDINNLNINIPIITPPSNNRIKTNSKRQNSENDDCLGKKKRDLLTADEKRFNHVASEQKRRNHIRSGFQALIDNVPSLSGNNSHSKSTILFKTSEFLKTLLAENRNLVEKVTALENHLHALQSSISPNTAMYRQMGHLHDASILPLNMYNIPINNIHVPNDSIIAGQSLISGLPQPTMNNALACLTNNFQNIN